MITVNEIIGIDRSCFHMGWGVYKCTCASSMREVMKIIDYDKNYMIIDWKHCRVKYLRRGYSTGWGPFHSDDRYSGPNRFHFISPCSEWEYETTGRVSDMSML